LEISGCFFQLSALFGGILLILSHLLKSGNDGFGLRREDFQGVFSHPFQPLGIFLAEESVGHIPQIFIGVNEIRDQGKVRKKFGHPSL